MNRKNIIGEGIIDRVLKKLFLKRSLKKDKKIKKEVDKLNTSINDFEKQLNSRLKELDPKSKPVKIDKFKI